MRDDRDAIWKAAQATIPRYKISPHVIAEVEQIEADLDCVAALVKTHAVPLRQMKASYLRRRRIRALRLLITHFGRRGIDLLGHAMSETSSHRYRLILRDRDKHELPDRGEALERANEERLIMLVVSRVTRLMDRADISRERAFNHVRRRMNLSYGQDRYDQLQKILRVAAVERGYVDPYAVGKTLFGNARHPEDLQVPKITVDRLTRRGRPAKKK